MPAKANLIGPFHPIFLCNGLICIIGCALGTLLATLLDYTKG